MSSAGSLACAFTWESSMMQAELRDQIAELIEAGAGPVTAGEIAAGPRRAGSRRTRWQAGRPPLRGRVGVLAVAGLTAGGVAAAVVLAAGTAPGRREPPAVLTAAMVARVASASRAALAVSGEVSIASQDSRNGVVQDDATMDISFDGANWNLTARQAMPTAAGQPATSQFAINRVVGGQAYYYIAAASARPRWYHDTGPGPVPMHITPDPRTLLGVLTPRAGFRQAGTVTDGGIRLRKLVATRFTELALPGPFPALPPGGRLSALTLWVDGSGVVRRMDITASATMPVIKLASLTPAQRALLRQDQGRPAALARLLRSGALPITREVQLTTLHVWFLRIGQPQPISAPAGAIPVSPRG
jgi:hypothetical protein